jgi:dissimilatory sulfite reductase (desulfoviridin) alpha/beta subunit
MDNLTRAWTRSDEPTIDDAIGRGLALESELHACPDCAVEPGNIHEFECDVERCSGCGMQRLSCALDHHEPSKELWTGIWPGEIACRERGWTTRPFPGHPFGMPDLNRYAVFSVTGVDPGSSF